MSISRAVAVIVLLAAPAAPLAAQSIDFDGTGAPCLFEATSPLATRYASLGVTFAGGGAILNECGNFGISARSGTDFLAFSSGGGYAVGPLQVAFANPIGAFSIYAGSDGTETFLLSAFATDGSLLGTSTVTAAAGTWGELAFADARGVSSVRVTTTAGAYVFDDLMLGGTVVPEPATFALVGGGLAGLVLSMRRRRAA